MYECVSFRDRCHIEMLPMGEVCILWAMKWELSLAASKMGETWSDGGPPLLGPSPACYWLGYSSAEITMILQSL